MFNDHDVVRLKRDLPSESISVGTIGTVVFVYPKPGAQAAYEVEFANSQGRTIGVITLEEEDIELVWSSHAGHDAGKPDPGRNTDLPPQ